MRDEIQTRLDPVLLWNATLAALADGIALPRRGQVRGRSEQALPPSDLPAFDIVTDVGPMYAQFLRLPIGALTQSPLEIADLSRLPQCLSAAILIQGVETILHEAGAEARRKILSVRRSDSAPDVAGEWLILTLDGVWGEVVELAVCAERGVLSALMLGVLPEPTGKVPTVLAARITLPCTLRLEGRTMPLSRLRQLGVGDVVLAGRGGLVLAAPHARFSLLNDGTNWTIGNTDMNDDLPTETLADGPLIPDEQPTSDIGAVPVRLSFVLSEHTLSVAELQGLTKGSLLPLAPVTVEPGSRVKVLANGQPVGDGHLVEIDGRPAIRIARIFGA